MKVAVFSAKPHDRTFLDRINREGDFEHDLRYFEPRLTAETATLAQGFPCVCGFVNDVFSREILEALVAGGTRLVALRCAGFNNVDVAAAADLGVTVARVPAYSPYAVAEHTLGLILALSRRIHKAYARVREGNFALHGLLGFELRHKTVGVVGTGKIGAAVVELLQGFGCRTLAYDLTENEAAKATGARYVGLDELLEKSDVVTLHLPLTPRTHHLIGRDALSRMKAGVVLINTSRGGLVDTRAVLDALKSGKIGLLGLDVYEEEADLFFEDLSNVVIQDDVFARLLTFPNVLITSHQAFFTQEALETIARTTLENVAHLEHGAVPEANLVRPAHVRAST